MPTEIKILIDPEVDQLLDPAYENILHRSQMFDQEKYNALRLVIYEFSELPTNLTKLCQALEDENSDAKHVADLIKLNPGLAGKVLKLVNSSFYGLKAKVSNLQRAVAVLGFNTVRSLLLGTCALTEMPHFHMPPELPIKNLWSHSVAVSQLAAMVSREVRGLDSSMLLSAGLLHDAGKLMLTALGQKEFINVIHSVHLDRGDLIEREISKLGISHPFMSAALCIRWHLPERLWRAILYQQHPGIADNRRVAAVMQLSEFYARTHGVGDDGQPPMDSPPEEALDVLGLTVDQAMQLVTPEHIEEIKEQIEWIAQYE